MIFRIHNFRIYAIDAFFEKKEADPMPKRQEYHKFFYFNYFST